MLSQSAFLFSAILLCLVIGLAGCSDSPTSPDNSGPGNLPTTAPPPPAGLTASGADGIVELLWQDTSSLESGYIVYRQLGTKAPSPIDTLPANATGYTDSTVTIGLSYRYFIRAYNALGLSPSSAQVVVAVADPNPPPRAPSKLVIKPSRDSLQVAWSDNSSDETGFELHIEGGFGRSAADTIFLKRDQSQLNLPLPKRGSYTFKVRAMRDRTASDFCKPVTWAAPVLPDIAVLNYDTTRWPVEIAPGHALVLQGWALENDSDTTLNVPMTIYLRPKNETLNRAQHHLKDLPSMLLLGGQTLDVRTPIIIPGSLPDGEYTVTIEADPDNDIEERSESNNMREITLTVYKPKAADLAITSTVFVAAPRPADAGQEIAVSGIDVKNIGTESSGTFSIGYYLSDDPTINTADFPMRFFDAALSPGGEITISAFNFTLPPTLATGTYYIGAVVDHSNLIDEIREDNNSIQIEIDINGI